MKGKNKWIKRMLLFFLGLCILIGIIHIISALTADKQIQYIEVPIVSEKIAPTMEGYRITFITDTHGIPATELQQVVDTLNEKGDMDLLLLGGDYPIQEATWRTMKILSGVHTRDGIYGVEGNHDSWENLKPAMLEYGMTPLSNEGVHVGEQFYLAGVEDLWNRNPNVPLATQGANQEDFVLLLTHNPDVTMQQDMSRVDYSIAGHTHGGQITFFGVWAPALTLRRTITDYGSRFQSGLCYNDTGDPVYVSNGTGIIPPVPRIFAPPQVITFVLQRPE